MIPRPPAGNWYPNYPVTYPTLACPLVGAAYECDLSIVRFKLGTLRATASLTPGRLGPPDVGVAFAAPLLANATYRLAVMIAGWPGVAARVGRLLPGSACPQKGEGCGRQLKNMDDLSLPSILCGEGWWGGGSTLLR